METVIKFVLNVMVLVADAQQVIMPLVQDVI
jgi:hypothetical protein